MNQTSPLDIWVSIAQILTALIALVGIGLSFWFSIKTLREVQIERVISQRPFLLFDYGGFKTLIEFIKHEDNKQYIQAYWPKINENGGIHVPTIGKLKNYGSGPAIDIKLKWIVEEVTIKGERFLIDDSKRKELKYSEKMNINPIMT
ncbi:MAG: hypothetical protein PHS84_09220, partial [Paludibacter sp.]|nr:hypothetical protein [Paludibacter sp.]